MAELDASFVTTLKQLCPMHLVLNGDGIIVQVGPTLAKLSPDLHWIGSSFWDVFNVRRPRLGASIDALRSQSGRKLHLGLRDAPQMGLKGVVVALPTGGAVLNLSFGIAVAEAVRDHDLTHADFCPTDLTVELLFLLEAKSAAMEASQKLNLRLQGAKIAAEEQAFTDTLTGLKNRRALAHVLTRFFDTGREIAIMHLDLDHFKAVNDTFGHGAGDYVLQEVARRLVDATRAEDTIARVGGDEFVLVLDRLTNRAKLMHVGARLISRLERPIQYRGAALQISASIGVAVSSDYVAPSTDLMIEDADDALYIAKEAGRGQVYLSSAGAERLDYGQDGACYVQ